MQQINKEEITEKALTNTIEYLNKVNIPDCSIVLQFLNLFEMNSFNYKELSSESQKELKRTSALFNRDLNTENVEYLKIGEFKQADVFLIYYSIHEIKDSVLKVELFFEDKASVFYNHSIPNSFIFEYDRYNDEIGLLKRYYYGKDYKYSIGGSFTLNRKEDNNPVECEFFSQGGETFVYEFMRGKEANQKLNPKNQRKNKISDLYPDFIVRDKKGELIRSYYENREAGNFFNELDLESTDEIVSYHLDLFELTFGK